MLFTFPSRYYFSIGRQTYLALGRGRPGFKRNFTCSALLGWRTGGHLLSLTGLSPSSAGYPNTVQLENNFVTPRHTCRYTCTLPLPHARNACRLTRTRFRLRPFRSPLLRASLRFLFLRLLRCFTSPGRLRIAPVAGLLRQGSPIRIPTDLGTLTPPRGFSQFAASFVGVWRQGIPRVPLLP